MPGPTFTVELSRVLAKGSRFQPLGTRLTDETSGFVPLLNCNNNNNSIIICNYYMQ